jgi:8-oxo-dGTP pyrophosphatase MutT (NUDIX family)
VDTIEEAWKEEKRGIFIVNLLAIVFDGTNLLIGKRRAPDPYIPELTWSFPGGRPTYDRSLELSLKDEVKKKTAIDIEILCLYHARLYSRPEFLNLYYLTEPRNFDLLPGEKFTDAKWVKPMTQFNLRDIRQKCFSISLASSRRFNSAGPTKFEPPIILS